MRSSFIFLVELGVHFSRENYTKIDIYYEQNKEKLSQNPDLGKYINLVTPRQFPYPKNMNYVDKLYNLYCLMVQHNTLGIPNHKEIRTKEELDYLIISYLLAEHFILVFKKPLENEYYLTFEVIVQGIFNLLKENYFEFHDADSNRNIVAILSDEKIKLSKYKRRVITAIRRNKYYIVQELKSVL